MTDARVLQVQRQIQAAPQQGDETNPSMSDMEPLVATMPPSVGGPSVDGLLPSADSLANLSLSPSLLPGMRSLADTDLLANLTEELKNEFKNDVEGGLYGDGDRVGVPELA